jgi:hypothetical protein
MKELIKNYITDMFVERIVTETQKLHPQNGA